jgi:hypothetical protein
VSFCHCHPRRNTDRSSQIEEKKAPRRLDGAGTLLRISAAFSYLIAES